MSGKHFDTLIETTLVIIHPISPCDIIPCDENKPNKYESDSIKIIRAIDSILKMVDSSKPDLQSLPGYWRIDTVWNNIYMTTEAPPPFYVDTNYRPIPRGE